MYMKYFVLIRVRENNTIHGGIVYGVPKRSFNWVARIDNSLEIWGDYWFPHKGNNVFEELRDAQYNIITQVFNIL